MVMPFICGGEMFYHLRAAKKFEEALCKFYASQVILAFDYIHFLGIVYRDLKPENILIDIDGYLKITDLGFCKKIDNQRTYTLCGKKTIFLINRNILNLIFKITLHISCLFLTVLLNRYLLSVINITGKRVWF